MKRLLITGSRTWTDYDTMKLHLWNAYSDLWTADNVLLISGSALGADMMAEDIWAKHVHPNLIERHPAKDYPHPLKRNDHMISLGADLCLGFSVPCTKISCTRPQGHGSHGTEYTLSKAKAAGINTRKVTQRN